MPLLVNRCHGMQRCGRRRCVSVINLLVCALRLPREHGSHFIARLVHDFGDPFTEERVWTRVAVHAFRTIVSSYI
jgi:hypothetical protein